MLFRQWHGRFLFRLSLGAALAFLLAGMVAAVAPATPVKAATTINTCDFATLSSTISSAASGDTITFGCSAPSTSPITFTSAITINKDLTIDVTSSSSQAITVTFDGGGSTQLFVIGTAGSVTFKHLAFQNGKAIQGGAIFNWGTTTLSNTSFTNNNSGPGGSGGAILNAGNLTVSNTSFNGNTGSYAGAIDNVGTLDISNNSSFTNNSALGSGGAIFNWGTITLSNTSFSGNSASGSGGAIVNYRTLDISTNSSFTNNSAFWEGGAIVNYGTTTVSNSSFNGNSANYYGGAIANYGTTKLSNSNFSGNSASFGGAIFSYGMVTSDNTSITTSAGGNCNRLLTNNGGNSDDDGTCFPPTLHHFDVSGYPSPVTAGTVGNITVTAKDNLNNVVTSYTGTIHFTSSDPNAALPADYQFGTSENGTHTFTPGVTLKTAGTQSITATDTVNSSIKGAQSNIQVTSDTAASLKLTAPATATAGSPFDLTVTAYDAYNNLATGYPGKVHFSSSDVNAVLPADYQFSAGDAGSYTFTNGATLQAAGIQTITVSDGPHTDSAGVTVGTSTASKISLVSGSGQSAPAGQGFANPLVVKVTDNFNNPVQGVAVAFAAPGSGASATLSSPALTDNQGQTSVSATANNTMGSYNVSASLNAGPSVSFNLSNCGAAGCQGTDLQISLSTSNSRPTIDQLITLTAVVKNNGPANASGVVAKISLPDSLKYRGNEPDAGTSYTPASGLWTIGNLNAGASIKLTLKVQVVATGQGKVVAEIIGMDQPDLNSANNSASLTINGEDVKLPAELSAQLQVNPDRVIATAEGTKLTLNFKVRNIGPGSARYVYARVPFDPELIELGGSNFADSRDWVKEVKHDGANSYVEIRFHDLAMYEELGGSLSFMVKAGVKADTELNLRYTILWDDDTGVAHNRTSNLAHLVFSQDNHNDNSGKYYSFNPAQLSVKRGEWVNLSADFFAPNEKVEFWYTGRDGKSVALGYAWANPQGKVHFELPTASMPGGVYNLSASGYFSQAQGTLTLTITEGQAHRFEATQASVKAGDKLTFSGNFFLPGEKVTYWYTGPDGKSVELGYVQADTKGAVNLVVETTTFAAGQFTLAAHGNTSAIEGQVNFEVNPK